MPAGTATMTHLADAPAPLCATFDGWTAGCLDQPLPPPAILWLDGNCPPYAMPDSVGFSLWISTRAAARYPAAWAFTQSLAARIPWLGARVWDVESAVQEAIGNAVVHGSLGIPGNIRNSLAGLVQFSRRLEAGLADPALAAIPILVHAEWTDNALTVSVTDQGEGFDPDTWEQPPPGSRYGRGLPIIRAACSSVAFSDGGRRITMVIDRS